MKTLHLLFILLVTFTGTHICNAFEIIEGEIKEITGPDDLNLDPGKRHHRGGRLRKRRLHN